MNLLDRVLMPLDPERVARRQRARLDVARMTAAQTAFGALAGDSSGGDAHKPLRWWRPSARSSDADTLRDIGGQRGQSRELTRTNALAAGAVRTQCDRVVGTGLALSAEPSRRVLGWTEDQAREWKRQVQTEFSLWSDSTECDLARSLDFYQAQELTLRAVLESGDTFTLLPDGARTPTMPYALRLQTIEADRVGNPRGAMDDGTMVAGIERGAEGAPQRCFVYDRHPGGSVGRMAMASLYDGRWYDFVGASGRRRILHHWKPTRPEQTRGVPYLAPVIGLLKQIDRYTEAEIQAAVVSAFFTVFIETEAGPPAPVFGAQADEASGEIGMGPGAVVGLAKGESANFANPNRPNAAFEGFVLAVLQQVGVGLGIPHELLVKRFDSSYSASRAALLDAWIFFRSQRTWLARSFCQPIYETWLAEAVAIGRVPAPGFFADPLMRWAYTRAQWHGDSQGSINPKDEVAAYTAAVDARLMTRERAEWELFGTDWMGTYDTKLAEHKRLKADDLLPAPKAGAAAPAPRAEPSPEPQE